MNAGLANNSDSYPNMESVSSPMRTILIPLDFSEASINAFRYGTSMAAQNNSRVILLHVYKLDMAGGYSVPYMHKDVIQKTEKRVMTQFQELMNELEEDVLGKINFNNIVCSGETVEEILRVSRVYHADHIVMGMRGENQMIRKILGGTSLSVINRASKPVLLIPYNTSYQPIQHIAYATNFEEEDPRIIDQLLKLAKPYNAKVSCVHIREQDEKQDIFKQEILMKAFEGDVSIENIDFLTLDYDNVVEGLNQFVKDRNVDVLVMLTHQRSIFSRLFTKSQTRQMAIESQVPLWAFSLQAPNG